MYKKEKQKTNEYTKECNKNRYQNMSEEDKQKKGIHKRI